jgi:hypothetical protein
MSSGPCRQISLLAEIVICRVWTYVLAAAVGLVKEASRPHGGWTLDADILALPTASDPS